MSLSELEKKRIEKLFTDYCAKKVPAQYHNELRAEFEIRGNEVSLFECRAPWRGEGEWTRMKVARFKKDPKTETWLYTGPTEMTSGNPTRRCRSMQRLKFCWLRWRRTKPGLSGVETMSKYLFACY